ncbi:hypothetical protein BDR05DRAFT_1006251 [Suillus weaverae]|nr:hypothetical protein BDR05DRAFT_1006251 [Suillus weaverae]
MPYTKTCWEPVPRVNPIPAPLIPPIFDFPDPVPVSPCAIEQEMLDHGTLTPEDIDIQIHGCALLNLSPNFHTPDALLDALDYFNVYNDVTSDFDVDVDMADMHLDEDLVDEDIAANSIQLPDNDEDSPDPFEPDDKFFMYHGNRAMLTIPPHLLTIYAVTTWLHLQWHLPRAACNALLSILGCLLLFLSPQLDTPFRTLQSATRVLVLDTPFYTLPCCPTG